MTESEKLNKKYKNLSLRLQLFTMLSINGTAFYSAAQMKQRAKESRERIYALADSFDLEMSFTGDYQLSFPINRKQK